MTRRDSSTLDYLRADDPIMTTIQMDNLPLGTVIGEVRSGTNQWTKQEDGWHGTGDNSHRNGAFRSDQFSMSGYNRVISIPEGWVHPATPPPDTLMQFMWKFRSNALAGATEHGVSIEAARKGLRLLRIPDEWEMGPGVRLRAYDNHITLPSGTVAANVIAADPDADTYTLFVHKRNGWSNLLGRRGLGHELILVDVPGVPETPAWWAEQGNEETASEVREFKARAWRVGLQIKGEQSWCGTYENVVARVGVTRKCLDDIKMGGFAIGDRVNPSGVAQMPDGTAFFFRGQDDHTRWALYVRDDNQNNATRTRRIAGSRGQTTRPLGNYATGMTMVGYAADGGVGWMLGEGATAIEVLAQMPPGTHISYGGSTYVRCHDNQWASARSGTAEVPTRGAYASEVFNSYPVTITRIEEQS